VITADLTRQILQAWPDLAGHPPRQLGQGFDSLALVYDDQVVRVAMGPNALQREAALLAFVAPHVTLALPQPRFHPGPPAMARHTMIPGTALDGAAYATLTGAERDRLAADLALFHAETHALDPARLRALGAGPVQPWPLPAPALLDNLPPDLLQPATRLLTDWAALPPDPLGDVWGHFDAHGWNMGFDARTGRLNGIFDFGDSGFGPLHRDLIYAALISPDLMRRLGRAYAALTRRAIDPQRLHILSGAHRLWELAAASDANRDWLIAAFRTWAQASPA
jgi:Ser/Thr protein kinase RdoA (MazF antagonist)